MRAHLRSPAARDAGPAGVPRWHLMAATLAVAWVLAGTLFGEFTAFIAFDHRAVGRAILEGVIPYRDFTFEYPPGAAGVLAIPALAGRDSYDLVFRALMAAAWGSMALTVRAQLPRALPGFLAGSVALTFLIGAGFDILIAASVMAAFLAMRGGATTRAATWLGVGTLVKLAPVMLVPLLARGHRPGAVARLAVATALALAAAVGLPALLAEEGNDPASYHAGRLLHAESAAGSVIVLQRIVSDDPYPVVFDHGSRNVTGAPSAARTGSLVAMALAIAVLWLRGRPDEPATWMAVLVAIPTLGPVASPQFLLWPLALVGLVGARGRWMFVLAGALSASMFTGFYPGEGTAMAILTVARNVALLVAFGFISWEALRPRSPAPTPQAA